MKAADIGVRSAQLWCRHGFLVTQVTESSGPGGKVAARTGWSLVEDGVIFFSKTRWSRCFPNRNGRRGHRATYWFMRSDNEGVEQLSERAESILANKLLDHPELFGVTHRLGGDVEFIKGDVVHDVNLSRTPRNGSDP